MKAYPELQNIFPEPVIPTMAQVFLAFIFLEMNILNAWFLDVTVILLNM